MWWQIAATAASLYGAARQDSAARKQRKAGALRNQQISLENERSIREYVRNAQRARAQTLAEGTAMGADSGRSSTTQGALSSISARASGELDFFHNYNELGGSIATFGNAAQSTQNQANMAGGLANIFQNLGSIFSND